MLRTGGPSGDVGQLKSCDLACEKYARVRYMPEPISLGNRTNAVLPPVVPFDMPP